jgi:hypothetical protein
VGAATYRIGPSDFFTPGDLQADAQTLDAQVSNLDSQIEGGEAAPPDYVDQWTVWLQQWHAFRDDHFGGWVSSFFSSLNDSNRDDLIRFENQFAAFSLRAQRFGADVVAPVDPSTGSKDTLGQHVGDQAKGLPSISTAAIITVAVAAVVVIVVWRKA